MKQTLEQSRPGLWRRLHRAVEQHKLSPRTQHLYRHWIVSYLVFHDLEDPAALSRPHIASFMDHLRHHWQLSRARLNQALMALVFLYEEVLQLPRPVELKLTDSQALPETG